MFVNRGKWAGLLVASAVSIGCMPLQAVALPTDSAAMMQTIREEAAKRYIAPINAHTGEGGKTAVPGYNGLEVDVERTLEKSQQSGGSGTIAYVYREVPPSVHLDDLGALPIYRGNPAKPMASIMINVAWGEEYLPTILQVLDQEKVRCTFFFDGSWLSKHIEEAQRIASLGHELSNHAYSHKNMSGLGDYQARDEIARTEQLLTQKLGARNSLFAPPSGDYSSRTVKLAHDMKLRTVLWTVDTIDWKHPPADAIVAKIARKAVPGALILMHPTDSSTAALPGMIREIRRKGLALGTVSDVLSERRVAEPAPQ